MVALAVGAGALFVANYAVMVWTDAGRALADNAYYGRPVGTLDAAVRGKLLFKMGLGPERAAQMSLVIFGLGLLSRRIVVAVVAAGSFGAAVAGAQVLKELLPQSSAGAYYGVPEDVPFPWYPSGHVTTVTAFALALVLVSGTRLRPAVAVLGAGVTSVITSATLAIGAHRPEDAVGGIALATACLAGGAAIILRGSRTVDPAPRGARYLLPGGLVVLVLGGIWDARHLFGEDVRRLVAGLDPAAYPLTSLALQGSAVAAVCGFAWLLRDVNHRRGPELGPAAT